MVLIGVNVFVWLLIVASGGDKGGLFDKLTLMARGRCETPDGGGFYPGVPEQVCSASQFTWVPGVSDGAGWQVVTSMFAHAELWHLASNMLALYFLGPMLESAVGRTRFLAIYLVSGLTGSAMVMALTHPYAQTLGASGAIFGLIGALFVISLKLKVNLQYVGTWLILGLVFSFFGPRDVSWQGHLGGLLGGALVAAIIVYAPRGERRTFVQWSAIGLVVLLTLMAIAARAIALSV
jgi:membrane associated rhomboid family serine protease